MASGGIREGKRMKILYEDKDVVVVLKPPHILSQFSENEENAVTILSEMTGSEIFVISRLDRNVGGVMVFAKNQKSAAELTKQMQSGNFEKEYIAVVYGCPEEDKGTFEDLLFKDSRKNKSFVVKKERKGVKKASLSYEVLEKRDDLSLVKIHLHTGRTHQIRVQFASRKMPLVGDGKYGAKDNSKNMGLFCREVSFVKGKEKLTFSAEPEKVFPWNVFDED